MAAHIGQPTRSRRFIKVYLMTWATLAVGAVAYLAMLTVPQQAAAPPPQADLDAAKTGAAVSKALVEVKSMQGSLSEIRKDVSQLQDAVGERVANEKVVQSRLTALEERVATIDAPKVPPTAAPVAKQPDKAARKPPESHTTADILARAQELQAPPAPKAPAPSAAPLETGSITSKTEIIFGEAIVKPASQKDLAVQLAARPSLQELRQSWGELVERHGAALAALKPRVVAPRAEGGTYRLLAGPVPSKADAERICAALGADPKACFATAYAGAPL